MKVDENGAMERNQIIQGDCLEVLKGIADNSFTAVVTDPPYGLSQQPDMREVLKHWLAGDDYEHRGGGFMGKEWDSFVPGPKIWTEIMRVLKPGGHILSFFGTRTYDIGVTAMRLAGAEVRDKIDYYCELEDYKSWVHGQGFPKSLNISKALEKSGHSEEAVKFVGYGSSLKPAHEPIACFGGSGSPLGASEAPFRYEAKASSKERNKGCSKLFWRVDPEGPVAIDEDEYNRLEGENEAGKDKEGFEPRRISVGNCHPTVKPIELCRYLVRLVKMPEDNLILDPFMGSGSVLCACILEGCDFVGIDKDPLSMRIADARVHYFRCLGEGGLK